MWKKEHHFQRWQDYNLKGQEVIIKKEEKKRQKEVKGDEGGGGIWWEGRIQDTRYKIQEDRRWTFEKGALIYIQILIHVCVCEKECIWFGVRTTQKYSTIKKKKKKGRGEGTELRIIRKKSRYKVEEEKSHSSAEQNCIRRNPTQKQTKVKHTSAL